MTDFNYKKYSLEQLENWIHDSLSASEATPREIYDTIKKVVQEQYCYYKNGASKTNELLQLLNGHTPAPITFNISSYSNEWEKNYGSFNSDDTIKFNTCSVGDTSEYCTNSWNSFWEDKPDEYDVREQEYYEKEDKVVKWQLPVNVDGLTGDCYVNFPDDLLEAANLKEGDEVEWVDKNDGTFILRKVTKPLGIDEC